MLSWREGVEKDLGEVLQIRQIFTNVSKGQFAKKEDVIKAFELEDIDKVIEFILRKGTFVVFIENMNKHKNMNYKSRRAPGIG